MKALTFQSVEHLAVEDVPDPRIEAPCDAVLRVRVAGICGSDLHPYFGREPGLDPGTVMGHEVVGEVVEVGPEVRSLAPGDRVVAPFTTSCGACFYCRTGLTARCEAGELLGWVQGGEGLHGTQAEAVRIPLADTTLVPVPEALDDDAVALLAGDILSTALFAADLARVGEGDLVAVVGCGPVGLLAVRAALERGAREVVAVDRVASRLEVARRFGATPVRVEEGEEESVVEPVRVGSGGRGADAAIEAVGTPSATRTAARLLRPGGRLAAVGVHTEPTLALSPGEIYDRNLTYASGRCPARRYLPAALALAERDRALLAGLISHRMPLARGVEGYRLFASRTQGCTKVVLEP
jgi:threonine dehydrogenase-like Zn-dependent dehydrogenase